MCRYLSGLKLGETATITELCADENIRRRFQDIGLIEGAKVECVMISPLGDPKAFEICGGVIAFRKDDIKGIRVV